jgi:hypothetical protein
MIILTAFKLNVGALIVDVHKGEVLIAEVRELGTELGMWSFG